MSAIAETPPVDMADAHTDRPELAGRRILITGGTTGIGRAIAVLLASEGARVFVCGRDANHLADALTRIGEVGDGGGIALDLTRQADVDRFVDEGARHLGGIDVLVLNAGLPIGGLGDAAVDDIRYVVDTNLTAFLTTARRALDHLGPGSDIVLIGSMSAVSRSAESTVYTATKTGVQAFANALRRELAEKGIKVGLIEPGLVGTDMQLPDTPVDEQREMIHEAKMLRAEDIAVATLFMLTQPRRTLVSMMRVEPLIAE